jgi:uncharacterized protein (DUF1015 family)
MERIVFCKHRNVTRFSPFRGLRYHSAESTQADISPFIAPPYDVLSDAQREALLDRDPANSVRLDYPNGKIDAGAYGRARLQLDEWIASGVLVLDAAPTFTVYRMTDPVSGHQTTGVFGALGLEHPGVGDVLPHEETTAKDKADRLSLIRSTEINTSPIWVLSVASGLGVVSSQIANSAAPSATGHDEAGVLHESWVVSDAAAIAEIQAIVQSAPVVVADGHHRLETALAYEAEAPEADSILSLVVELSPDELDVRPIHRIIDAPSVDDLVSKLANRFELVPALPDLEHSSDGPVLLIVREQTLVRFVLKPLSDSFDASTGLDSQRIRIALRDLAGAETQFHHDSAKIANDVRAGRATAGILLRPATVAQIRAVADARTRMPPKTTFFYPKPRTGIVFRPVSEEP